MQDPSAVVVDHSSYAVSETEGDHTLIAADDFIQSDVILGNKKIEVSFPRCTSTYLVSSYIGRYTIE